MKANLTKTLNLSNEDLTFLINFYDELQEGFESIDDIDMNELFETIRWGKTFDHVNKITVVREREE